MKRIAFYTLALLLFAGNAFSAHTIWGDISVTGKGIFGSGTEATIFLGSEGASLVKAVSAVRVDAIESQLTLLYVGFGAVSNVGMTSTAGTVGLNVAAHQKPASSKTASSDGLFLSNFIGTSNYGVGAEAMACKIGNYASFQNGLGDGGSATLDLYGIFSVGANAVLQEFTYNDVYAGYFSPSLNVGGTLTSAGDAWGVRIVKGVASQANEYGLDIDTPTEGTNNYQVNLRGTGDGSGIWLGGTGGCRINAQPIADACAGTVIEAGATYELCATCN